ncbi:MAG: HutD/Ves family protein [Beijerinckiaceae bacterium]
MPMHILRATDYQRMPWKNGVGETVQMAVDDAARGLDDFAWRISMATVASDGPFSLFPGVDRTLCVLEGEGLALALDGRPPVELTRQSPPFSFPADIPVASALMRGAIIDLNVMTRRGRARHFVSRMPCADQTRLTASGDILMLFAFDGAVTLESNGKRSGLGVQDSALMAGPLSPIAVFTEKSMTLFAIDIWLV